MSEYKYACPVCGQHMKCDSSQAGTVMECPTCFQKIIAPQAPAGDDQKFVLTGTKVGERPAPKIATEGSPAVAAVKNSPVGAVIAVVILIVLIGAGAAVFAFRAKIFKSTSAPVVTANDAGRMPEKKPAPPKPVVVAPPANDANWMLDLGAVTNFPATPAVGRIHGQDFICERAYMQNGALTLRSGTRGPAEFGVTINFSGAQAEALAGQSINVTTNADTAARVTLRWKDGDQAAKENYENGYALRLEFGALAGNHIPGKIYLCAPDDLKSYVMGTFNAEIRKPKPPKQKK